MGAWPRYRAFVYVLLGSAALWIATSALGSITTDTNAGLAAIYLPIGFAVAMLVRLRSRVLWWAATAGIVLGAVVLSSLTNATPPEALLSGTANAIEAATVAWLLLRFTAERFNQPRDVFALALAGVLGCAVGAGLGTVAAWAVTGTDPLMTASTWFAADLVGIVLITPMAAIIRLRPRFDREVLGYLAYLAASTCLAVIAVRAPTLGGAFGGFLAWYALLMVLLAAGIGYGAVGLGLVQIPAAIAAFAIFGDTELQPWDPHQSIALVLGLSLLWAVLAVRQEIVRRTLSESLTTSLFTSSPVATARIGLSPGEPARLLVKEANAAWCDLLNLDVGNVINTDLMRFVHPDDIDDVLQIVSDQATHSRSHRDVRLIRRGGERTLVVRLTSVTMAVTDTERTDMGLIVVAEDVTERREAEDRLHRQARTDGLTGLLNRIAVTDGLEEALLQLGGASASLTALFIDLDGFKAVNDSLGHAAGDQVLKEVSTRLLDAVRPRDAVSRYGGDEFLIVASGLGNAASSQALVDRIHQSLTRAMDVQGSAVHVRASIGIATAAVGDTVDSLLARADADMYARKTSTRI